MYRKLHEGRCAELLLNTFPRRERAGGVSSKASSNASKHYRASWVCVKICSPSKQRASIPLKDSARQGSSNVCRSAAGRGGEKSY